VPGANVLMALVVLAGLIGPVAPGRQAETAEGFRAVYAPGTETLLFEQVAPAGMGKVSVLLPWSGQSAEINAQYADGVWRAQWSVAELPIWTEIRYQWQIAPEQGDLFFSEWRTVDRPDPASAVRKWTHTAGAEVDVYTAWISERDAQQIAAAADVGYRRAVARLGETAHRGEARPRVVVVVSEMDYAMLTDHGGGGYANFEAGVTLQWLAGYTIEQLCAITIPHEMFHLLDPTASRPDVPAWFTEGLAVHNETEQSTWARDALKTAKRLRTFIPGDRMAEYPDESMDEVLWYAQAWSMVEQLSDDQVDGLLAALVRGVQFLPAWRAVISEEPEAWMVGYMKAQMRRAWPTWLMVGVALTAVGCLVAWGKNRVRARRGLEG